MTGKGANSSIGHYSRRVLRHRTESRLPSREVIESCRDADLQDVGACGDITCGSVRTR